MFMLLQTPIDQAGKVIDKAQEVAANPNLDKVLSYLDKMGEKLGAAGKYLFAAYAKYVMADALACIIGFTFLGLIVGIGIPVMLIRFRSNAEKNGTIKNWDNETRGLNSGLRIVFMLVGAWIICASIVMNLGTIIAPEGAVVADILGKSR